MTDLRFDEFKKNPILYLLFLGFLGTIVVSKMLLKEKDNSKEEIKIQLIDEKIERRKIDSLNHVYIELLTTKKVLDEISK